MFELPVSQEGTRHEQVVKPMAVIKHGRRILRSLKNSPALVFSVSNPVFYGLVFTMGGSLTTTADHLNQRLKGVPTTPGNIAVSLPRGSYDPTTDPRS